jgi:hypothetical protein
MKISWGCLGTFGDVWVGEEGIKWVLSHNLAV